MIGDIERKQDEYRARICSLPHDAFTADAFPNALQIYPAQGSADGRGISVMYAPFEHLDPRAKVLLIGITPGASQMRRAWLALSQARSTGAPIEQALSEVKRVSAFNDDRNQMRPNLYRELEHWGVPEYLGYPTGPSLFDRGWGDLQATSLIPYPTFVNGKNYNGKSPRPLAHDFLRSLVMERFVPLVRSVPQALLLPLGAAVESVVRDLYREEVISNPCVFGMLHPSGENIYRLNYLCGTRSGPAPSKTSYQPYDEGRSRFRHEFLSAGAGAS